MREKNNCEEITSFPAPSHLIASGLSISPKGKGVGLNGIKRLSLVRERRQEANRYVTEKPSSYFTIGRLS